LTKVCNRKAQKWKGGRQTMPQLWGRSQKKGKMQGHDQQMRGNYQKETAHLEGKTTKKKGKKGTGKRDHLKPP